MGVFLQVLLFPDGNEPDCHAALRDAAAEGDMGLKLDECHWHLYDKGPAVLLNEGSLGYDVLTQRLSEGVSSPVMDLYIYDDDYWGYWVYQRGAEVDCFASLPEHSGPGNAPLLAQLFHVPAQDLLPYLTPWREEDMEADLFAREGDSAVIGDSWQMADFMAALGFSFDALCPPPPPREVVCPPQKGNAPSSAEPVAFSAPVDTPELPTTLTHLPYALERLAEVEDFAAQAAQFIREEDYQSALPLLTAAIGAHPDCPALYILRGFCWNQLEGVSTLSRKPDMDRDMTKLLELDPENRDHYQVSRAYRHHWLGDEQTAKADLQEVLDRGKIWTLDLTYLCRELGLIG